MDNEREAQVREDSETDIEVLYEKGELQIKEEAP